MPHQPRDIIAVDVGNSRVKFGYFRTAVDVHSHGSPVGLPECLKYLAIPLSEEIPWEKIFGWRHGVEAGGELRGFIAGANPAVVDRVRNAWLSRLGCQLSIVEVTENIGLDVRVDEPNRVGIDRLLNAVAANQIRPGGEPTIVVDAGTATTVDLVSTDGAFEGGAILPGIELAALSLNQYTALLPLIGLDELTSVQNKSDSTKELPAVGENTHAAIASGLYWGHVGAIRELIQKYEEHQRTKSAQLILTGGGSELLLPAFPHARHEPYLALQGLVLAGIASN